MSQKSSIAPAGKRSQPSYRKRPKQRKDRCPLANYIPRFLRRKMPCGMCPTSFASRWVIRSSSFAYEISPIFTTPSFASHSDCQGRFSNVEKLDDV